MGSNSAPLIAHLFLFCYERDFMASSLIVKTLKLFKHFNNPYFEGKVSRIYPPELQLNKANAFYTEAPYFFAPVCPSVCLSVGSSVCPSVVTLYGVELVL